MVEEICLLAPEEWETYKHIRLEAMQNDPTAFGKSFAEEAKTTEEEWRRKLVNAAQKQHTVLLFLRIDGKVVGMGGMYAEQLEKLHHIANIVSIYISPEYRGKGMGKKLFHELLLEIGKIQRIKKIKLTVNADQAPAVALYESFGFRRVGVMHKELCVDGEFHDEILMEKIL